MPIQLASNLYRIQTLGSFINSYAFLNEDSSVTLIDCGLDNAPKKLLNELSAIKKHPNDVTNIILTHAHEDHVGGAAEMIKRCQPKDVLMHENDSDLVKSGKTPSRDNSTLSGKLMSLMPSRDYAPFEITRRLKDGDLLDVAGGIQVIHTPGHTDGHISLLHLESETLITGDSIFNMTSRMTWALSGFCVNYKQSQETARRFLDVNFKNVAFTHGPEIREIGKERIKKFLSKKSIS